MLFGSDRKSTRLNSSHLRILVCRLLLEIGRASRSEEHTSELQSPQNFVCRLLLEKKTALPAPLVARINDVHSYGVPGVTVNLTDIGAGGTFVASSLVTNSFCLNDAQTTEISTLSQNAVLPF